MYQGLWRMAYDFSLYPKSAIILLSSMFVWMTLPTPSALAASTPMPFLTTWRSTTHPFSITVCGYSTCKILSHTIPLSSHELLLSLQLQLYLLTHQDCDWSPIPSTPWVRLFPVSLPLPSCFSSALQSVSSTTASASHASCSLFLLQYLPKCGSVQPFCF